jgi:hypothetical protein
VKKWVRDTSYAEATDRAPFLDDDNDKSPR